MDNRGSSNEEYFIIIYPTGQVRYLGITPFKGMKPEEYLPQFIRDTIMSDGYSYVNCNNKLLHKHGIGVSGLMQRDFIMFFGYDGIANELADFIAKDDELPRATNGHVGTLGTVVIAWVTHLPNGKLSVSGIDKKSAVQFVERLLKLYDKECGIKFK